MATASSYNPKSYCQVLALTLSLPLASVATTAAAQSVGSVTRDTNLGGRNGQSGGTVDRGGNTNQGNNDRARAEKEKAERERAEKARAEQAQAEKERAARERAEKERAEKARAEQAQAEKDRAARERAEKERAEKARAEQAQAEKDRAARERAEKERAEKARAEQAQAEKERAARERAEKERAEKARAEQAQAEKDRAARERAEKERAERERDDDKSENGRDAELDDLAIGRVTASGSGCAAGTWTATIDDTGRGFKVEFKALSALIKPTQAESVSRCRLSIAVPPKSGGTSYRVGQFDYAGYTYLENGVKGEFVTDYVFAGDPSTAVNVTTELGGPLDREYSVTDHADGEALWSPCSNSNTLNVDVTIRLKNGAARADGMLEVTNATGLGFDMRACD